MDLQPINNGYHKDESFREQLSVLYPVPMRNNASEIILLRSYVNVCLPGVASFDVEKPGSDTAEGWAAIDNQIENEGVRGIFHTHPKGVDGFSQIDWGTMKAFAHAYGERMLFYGIQALGISTAVFVALHKKAGRIFVYDLGRIHSDPRDSAIVVPLPPRIESVEDMYRIQC